MSQYPLISLRKHPFLLALRRWRRLAGREKGKTKGVSSCFIFVLALSQFRGPDYFGAWNRLAILL